MILIEKEIILYLVNFLNYFFYMNGEGKKLIEKGYYKILYKESKTNNCFIRLWTIFCLWFMGISL